jgi:hypothetical protein
VKSVCDIASDGNRCTHMHNPATCLAVKVFYLGLDYVNFSTHQTMCLAPIGSARTTWPLGLEKESWKITYRMAVFNIMLQVGARRCLSLIFHHFTIDRLIDLLICLLLMLVFWVVTQCGLVGGYQYFEEHTASITLKLWYLPTSPHSVINHRTNIDIFTTLRNSTDGLSLSAVARASSG